MKLILVFSTILVFSSISYAAGGAREVEHDLSYKSFKRVHIKDHEIFPDNRSDQLEQTRKWITSGETVESDKHNLVDGNRSTYLRRSLNKN